jgi:hypothetical protein
MSRVWPLRRRIARRQIEDVRGPHAPRRRPHSGRRWLAVLTVAGAIVVFEASACAGAPTSSSAAFSVALLLAVVSAALLVRVAGFAGEDDDDGPGGGPGRDRSDPRMPSGGVEFDWDAFERGFRAYARDRERAPIAR